jgi:hypothetical protein
MSISSGSMGGAGRDHGVRPHVVNPYARRNYPPHDQNLQNFLDNWESYKDRLSIFLGAGASVGALNADEEYVPTAAILRDELWARFMSRPGEKTDLGAMSLEHACALIEAKVGWRILREHTVKRFNCRLPLWQHCILPLLSPKAIFTTNYDNLIELGWARQFGKLGIRNYALTFRADGASHLDNIPLFKPHGTVEQSKAKILEGGLVLSLFDYFEVIANYQEMLRKFLQNFSGRCVIFVGYSFMDMDIGAEIYRMRKNDKGVHWYAVFPRDDSDVRSMYQDQFAIKQINRTFFDFLTDLDAEKNFIPSEWKVDRIPILKGSSIQ